MLAGSLLASLCAHGETFVVTRTDDPVPDGCVASDCSLREAIIAANVDPAFDIVQLGAGTFHVADPRIEIDGALTIQGAGIAQTSIEGDGSDDLLNVNGNSAFALQDLSIDAQGMEELDIGTTENAIVQRVSAPNPLGRIVRLGSGDGSTFLILDSDIHAAVECTAVFRCQFVTSRFVRITNPQFPMIPHPQEVALREVIIDGTFAPGQESGVHLHADSMVTLVDSVIRATTDGAVILTQGLDSVRTDYLENQRPMDVHAVLGDITDSEFRDNVGNDLTHRRTGALWIHGEETSVTVSGSTFTGNRGTDDAGGAVLVEGGAVLVIDNSTFSGNSFDADAAAAGARGGAIGYRADVANITSLVLRHVTVVAPRIGPQGIEGSALGGYGGVDGLALNILNSILSGNCALDPGAIDFNFGNIESPSDTCGLVDPSNQVNVSEDDLALGTLGLYGGRTPTYVPAENSVAIDAASTSQCLDFDQRGYARPYGNGCDIGAVEVTDFIFADGFEDS